MHIQDSLPNRFTSPLRSAGPRTERKAPATQDAFEPSRPSLPELDLHKASGTRLNSKVKIAAIAAAGLGLGVVAAGVLSGPTQVHIQVQMTTREAARATEDFETLSRLAQAGGGGLKTEPTRLLDKLRGHQPEVDSGQALQTLLQGRSVYFYPGAGSVPVEIRNPEELRDLTREVKNEVTKARFREGAHQFKEGFRNLGRQIGDVFR